jgi:signal transduction histidine kinase
MIFCLAFFLVIGQLAVPALAQAQTQSAPDVQGAPSRGPGTGAAPAESDLASKRVLILHSFAYDQPAYRIIDNSLRESFVASGLNFNNLYFEFLDLARNPGQEYQERLIELFQHKYKGRKIDLVLTLHQEALRFLLKAGRDFYPEGPIISILGDINFSDYSEAKRPIIYLPFSIDVASTAKAIFSLQPDTRKIVVIAGSSALDRRFGDIVRAALKVWKPGLDVESIPPLPLDEILRKVAHLPAGTAILYTTVYADSAGKTYMPTDALRMISKAANAPVFGMFETLLGDDGVVGGIMLNHRVEAERAVRSAIDILRGNVPAKPLTILTAPLVPMFDWVQIKRWGLDESALPADAMILNKPVSVWGKYKGYIVAAVVLCLAETGLIVFLIVQRRRKKVAEASLSKANEELRNYQTHLEELVEERTDELVGARERAEAANQAKSAFLTTMSHELRTPLNSILGGAQLLQRDREFPPKQRKLLDIISRSGAHLLELINDVLEISKIEAGRLTATSTPFALHRFLDDLERIMSHRAEQKGLHWSIDRDPGLPRYIQSDERKLRQVLINLVGNALKYTEKGHVTLRVREKKAADAPSGSDPTASVRLAFEIEDTGIGIAREDRERIFEPFVQLYRDGAGAVEGTGLGLALSRSFVRLLGGDISVRSEPGRGSTFLFDITVGLAEVSGYDSPADFPQVAGVAPGQPRYTLLVADDNADSRLLMRELLEQAGFAIVEAIDGREAIEAFKTHQPHLICMDLRMPVMDGYEAARRIREEERKSQRGGAQGAHTPVIAFTAHVMSSDDQPVESSLFDGFIRKPVNAPELFRLLGERLGVKYIYREASPSGTVPGGKGAAESLNPDALSAVGVEWLKRFRVELGKGYPERILSMVEQIRPENAALAAALEKLVRVHRFDRLVSLTEQALQEVAHA